MYLGIAAVFSLDDCYFRTENFTRYQVIPDQE
jgi:hypothetical protein